MVAIAIKQRRTWVASNSCTLILITVAGSFALLGAAGLRSRVRQVGALPQPAAPRWAEYEALPASRIEVRVVGAVLGRVCRAGVLLRG